MTEPHHATAPQEPSQLFCPQCGKAMMVDPQHVRTEVACPHCSQRLEPWRMGAVAAATPAPAPPLQPSPAQPGLGAYSQRNRWIAGALAILLGSLGVHRFYLGYKGIGMIQLLLTVGSLFMLTWVVGIWAFIEGILCFVGAMRDADGLPLRG